MTTSVVPIYEFIQALEKNVNNNVVETSKRFILNCLKFHSFHMILYFI